MPTSFSSGPAKRRKIVYSALTLAGIFGISLYFEIGGWGALILILATYALTVESLDRDLRLEEWLVFPLYSILTNLALYTWASQYVTGNLWLMLLSTGVCAVVVYGLLLTLNILNIATVRSLPLARTAKTVLSMFGLVVSFALFYLTIISQPSLGSWILYVGGISLLAAWPLIWTSLSEKQRLIRSFLWTILASGLLMQLAALVAFWPISFMTSLFLAGMLTIILGIVHLQEQRQLTDDLKKQYLMVGGVVALVLYVITQW